MLFPVGLILAILATSQCSSQYPSYYRHRDPYYYPYYNNHWDHSINYPYYAPESLYYPQYPYIPYGRPTIPNTSRYPYWYLPRTSRTVPYPMASPTASVPPIVPTRSTVGQETLTWPFTDYNYNPLLRPSTSVIIPASSESLSPPVPPITNPIPETIGGGYAASTFLNPVPPMMWPGTNFLASSHEPIPAESVKMNSDLKSLNPRQHRLYKTNVNGPNMSQREPKQNRSIK